jgi:hypothetical protein
LLHQQEEHRVGSILGFRMRRGERQKLHVANREFFWKKRSEVVCRRKEQWGEKGEVLYDTLSSTSHMNRSIWTFEVMLVVPG